MYIYISIKDLYKGLRKKNMTPSSWKNSNSCQDLDTPTHEEMLRSGRAFWVGFLLDANPWKGDEQFCDLAVIIVTSLVEGYFWGYFIMLNRGGLCLGVFCNLQAIVTNTQMSLIKVFKRHGWPVSNFPLNPIQCVLRKAGDGPRHLI